MFDLTHEQFDRAARCFPLAQPAMAIAIPDKAAQLLGPFREGVYNQRKNEFLEPHAGLPEGDM